METILLLKQVPSVTLITSARVIRMKLIVMMRQQPAIVGQMIVQKLILETFNVVTRQMQTRPNVASTPQQKLSVKRPFARYVLNRLIASPLQHFVVKSAISRICKQCDVNTFIT